MRRIAVTGAAGHIAYSLLFQIGQGALFGDEPVQLELLDLPQHQKKLEGLAMELEDCAFGQLERVRCWSDPYLAFEGVDLALLIGAKPRGPGMERKELLQDNGKIFAMQGRALNEVAARHVQVVVVGNPCNTNAWIAQKEAPSLSPTQFYAMMQLDQNRLQVQLALQAGLPYEAVTHSLIWGNHSSTQVPDLYSSRIQGRPAIDQVAHPEQLLAAVQQRGAAIIAASGHSSAASAAHALVQTVRNIYQPTRAGHWFSLGIWSYGNPYGIDQDLIFGFPCRSRGEGRVEIAEVELHPALRERLKATEQELQEERQQVMGLVGEVARGCSL
jgi:malate dehydrogenase